jgi:hypothetical protein
MTTKYEHKTIVLTDDVRIGKDPDFVAVLTTGRGIDHDHWHLDEEACRRLHQWLSENVELKPRQETGPLQIGAGDWPGVFIRGDHALQYATMLRDLVADQPPITKAVLNGLISDLESCDVKKKESS